MDFFNDLFGKKSASAHLAKERLSILIATNRVESQAPDFFPKMREEILQVIGKYVAIDHEAVTVLMERSNGVQMLEIDIPLK
jgi:cell division topological specificity factor